MRFVTILVVALPTNISGFIAAPRLVNSRSDLDDVSLIHRFGAVDDVRNLMRDQSVFFRQNLLPVMPDEKVIEPIALDYEAIGDTLESSDSVNVFTKRNWLTRPLFIGFEPKNNPKGVGFVFYPGAFVPAEGYAPLCRQIAELGYHAVVCTPPLLLSLSDVTLADEVIGHYGDDVTSWAVSGHSMGGVVAAAYANQHVEEYKDKLKGVILLASYPSPLPDPVSAGDLSDDNYCTTSIFGSKDGLIPELFIELSKMNLPETTKFVCIEGGNHSQFYYGTDLQKGDNQATISREEQQAVTLQSICDVLASIGEHATL